MDLSAHRLIALFAITVCALVEVEGGWRLYKANQVNSYCYSYGIRRFIKPPSLQECLKFCERYRMKFCEYNSEDGFCYAKASCSKMHASQYQRVLNIYAFTKGPNFPISSGIRRRVITNPGIRRRIITSHVVKPNPVESSNLVKPSHPVTPSNLDKEKGAPLQTRNPSRPLTLKIGMLVACDLADAFYSLYGITDKANREDILKAQVLTNYLDGLNTIFSDKSIGNLNVTVIFTYFSVVPQSAWCQWKDIYTFCKSAYQTELFNVDTVIYLVKKGGASSKGVKLTSAGQAINNGICKRESRCGMVNEVASVNTANKRLTAHELGHIIGLIDDGSLLQSKLQQSREARHKATKFEYPYNDMRCLNSVNEKSVMGGTADVWSVCSKDRLKTIFGSDLSICLEIPAGTILLPKPSDLVGRQEQFTREEICEKLKGHDAMTASWSVHYREPKEETDCKFSKGQPGECILVAPSRPGQYTPKKVMDDVSFMQGAKCSKGSCYFGDCLSDDEIVSRMKKMTNWATEAPRHQIIPRENYPIPPNTIEIAIF